jgi:hypothetical protein
MKNNCPTCGKYLAQFINHCADREELIIHLICNRCNVSWYLIAQKPRWEKYKGTEVIASGYGTPEELS